jgi:hypothetical protein
VKRMLSLVLLLGLSACQTPEGGVANKVLSDFGLKERPEGYVSASDAVFERLDTVGKTELKRMNLQHRHGEVKTETEGLRTKFYKEVKVYEKYYPLDARATPGTTGASRGFTGSVDYSYKMFQSERFNTRVEAEAASANTPTEQAGRETYSYKFGPTGAWDGDKGELTRR